MNPPGKALEPDAAAAAEALAEAQAAAWVEDTWSVSPGEEPGWFREESLGDETPGPPTGGTPGAAAIAPTAETTAPAAGPIPDAGPAVVGGGDDAPVTGGDAAAPAPAAIYPAASPAPEDAAARPRRRSPLVSVLVGLLILVVVGAGGFGIGMLLPLLIPLPDGGTAAASPATSAGPGATPGASLGGSPSPSAPASTPPPPSASPAPASTPAVYIVRSGDQLGRIAASFGVTLQAIQAANGITNPNLIIPGQKLVIPSPGLSASSSPGASPAPSASGAP